MKQVHDVIIIGAGLSGLSTAHFIEKQLPGLDILLIEKSERFGGAVKSFKEGGFQGEWGPHGFLDNTLESQELLYDIGLYDNAQNAPLGDFYRYVCHDSRLERLPQSLKSVLKTPLVPFCGKLRVLADLWKKPVTSDQTIGDWVAYRFGKDLLHLVDAAVTGSFAGDYSKLSIDSVMPGIRQVEKKYGSVLRGLIKKKKEAKSSPKKKRLPSMLNFPDGMETLTSALAEGKQIQFGAGVNSIARNENVWEVSCDNGVKFSHALVVALPVNPALKLLGEISSPPLDSIPVSKIINVVMGFTSDANVPYGFGYLAPERENRFTLGAMFTSHMFPDRAPEGHVLLEALVGGRRHPDRLLLSDEELVKHVYADLRELIELPGPPAFTRVLRPEQGIPQMEMQHPKLLLWRQQMEKIPGLHICGFGWDGIGMNDMIKTAKRTALALKSGEKGVGEEAKVKPVYF